MTDYNKIEYIRKAKFPFRIWDIIIYVVAITLIVTLTFTVFNKKGDNVIIINDGKSAVYSLSKNWEIPISDKLKVIIKDGNCYVTEATCKNKTCMNMGKISRVHHSITCAQNKVVVKIIGKSDLAGVVG